MKALYCFMTTLVFLGVTMTAVAQTPALAVGDEAAALSVSATPEIDISADPALDTADVALVAAEGTPTIADPAPAIAVPDSTIAAPVDPNAKPGALVTSLPVEPSALKTLFASKAWSALAGAILLLLIWGANTFGLKNAVGPKYIPWIAAGLGILSAIGTNLYAGAPWVDALFGGFTSGATSVGLYQMVFQKFLPTGVTMTDVHDAVAKGIIKPKA